MSTAKGPLKGRAARLGRLMPSGPSSAARTPFVLLVVVLLAGGLISLLLLNSALNQGSFQLNELKNKTTELTDEQQALQRDVDDYAAPDALERRARELGMVPGGSPAFLGPDGKVLGEPSVAVAPKPTPTPKATPKTPPGTGAPATTSATPTGAATTTSATPTGAATTTSATPTGATTGPRTGGATATTGTDRTDAGTAQADAGTAQTNTGGTPTGAGPTGGSPADPAPSGTGRARTALEPAPPSLTTPGR
ncbi:FtsB family cell division protein [Streptomyces wedmorensis]